MKNTTKTILGAAGLISLGAVSISYFDESIEQRTSAADTYDQNVFIHSFDLHYEADTLGTFDEYTK